MRSFACAFRGLGMMLTSQANARIHALATLIVVGLGVFLQLERWEWCAVLFAIGLVWTAEGLNTAIETLTDLVSPGEHPLAGRAKDAAAGAVLCAAMVAAVIGAIVFLPRLAACWPG
jgi:diacylglycerol kinase